MTIRYSLSGCAFLPPNQTLGHWRGQILIEIFHSLRILRFLLKVTYNDGGAGDLKQMEKKDSLLF